MPTLNELRETDPIMAAMINQACSKFGRQPTDKTGFSFTYQWSLQKLDAAVDFVVTGTLNALHHLGGREPCQVKVEFEAHFELLEKFPSGLFHWGGTKDAYTITVIEPNTGQSATVTDDKIPKIRASLEWLFRDKIHQLEHDLYYEWELSKELRRVRNLEAKLRSRALDQVLTNFGPLEGSGPTTES